MQNWRDKMKKIIYNMVTILLIAGMLNNCASTYRRPESFAAKMSRFEKQKTENISVPNIELPDVTVTSSQEVSKKTRSIASQYSKIPLTHSNKRLYFLTLLSQYNNFRNYSQKSFPSVNFCPNFHSSMLRNKGQVGQKQEN